MEFIIIAISIIVIIDKLSSLLDKKIVMEEKSKITELDYIRLSKIIGSAFNQKGVELNNLDSLAREINRAKKVDSKKISPEFVTMNSVIQVIIESTKKPMTIKIVYPKEADFKKGHVSVFSPLGCALLGHKVGDIVKFDAPKGLVSINIQQIDYQPEANGEYLV